MFPGRGVAVRIAGLCLDETGRLSDNAYLGMAVRGGVLVDLALIGRVTQTDDSIELHPYSDGWPPADRVLGELASLDGQSLDWWLEHSALGAADLAAALVEDGSWQRIHTRPWRLRGSYTLCDPGHRVQDLALLSQPDGACSAEDAAVVSVAAAAGLVRGWTATSDEALLARTEPARWMCQLVIDFISGARAKGIAVSHASQTALWSNIPY